MGYKRWTGRDVALSLRHCAVWRGGSLRVAIDKATASVLPPQAGEIGIIGDPPERTIFKGHPDGSDGRGHHDGRVAAYRFRQPRGGLDVPVYPGGDAWGATRAFYPGTLPLEHPGHVERFGATGISSRKMGGQNAVTGLRADGEEFPVEAAISHTTVGGRRFYTGILRDITQRQRAEEALRESRAALSALSASLQSVRERSRIARELHDDLGQRLTALGIDMDWIIEKLPDDQPALRTRTKTMRALLEETVRSVRHIAAD